MVTARNVIESAARKIHILGRGQTLSADEAQNGLEVLNDILGSGSADDGMIFTQNRQTFNLSGATSYTIGSGADFNTTRPFSIINAFCSDGEIDYNLTPANVEQYDSFNFKNVTGTPEYFYYDNNHPTGTIYLFPTPNGVSTITLTTLDPLTEFVTLDTDYDLPAPYRKFLKNQTAIEWATEFEMEAKMSVQREAIKSRKQIEKYNGAHRVGSIRMDNALISQGRSNIYTGGY